MFCFFLFLKCWFVLVHNLTNTINQCVKSIRIRSYSGPHFPAFGQNTERYSASIRIQSECGRIRTRISPSTNTFYATQTMIIQQFLEISSCIYLLPVQYIKMTRNDKKLYALLSLWSILGVL